MNIRLADADDLKTPADKTSAEDWNTGRNFRIKGKDAMRPNDESIIDDMSEQQSDIDATALADVGSFKERFIKQLETEIIGQKELLEDVLAAFFAEGHVLLTGAPGLGKTKLARVFAKSLDLKFERAQFTPDMTPSDLLGSTILQESSNGRFFEFQPGVIFANVLLADEINRTPPKTQAALLEAMQERQVTIGGKRRPIEPPFFVIATRNPIEQEGTYPLPEAQLDRFIFSLNVDYPKMTDEVEMALRQTSAPSEPLEFVASREQVAKYLSFVKQIHIPRRVAEYAVAIVRKTRPQAKNSSESTQQYVEWGASPRASIAILSVSKSYAAFDGRPTVAYEDVERAAIPVLRSRVKLNYLAQADGVTVDFIARQVLREVRAELKDKCN